MRLIFAFFPLPSPGYLCDTMAAIQLSSSSGSPPGFPHSTGSGTSTAGGAPKLRDSCLGCASSKVRCPRQKPSCSRCLKRNIRCEYLASKRAGRKHDDSDSHASHGTNPERSLMELLLNNPASLNALFAAGTGLTTAAPDDAMLRLFPTLSNWLAPNAERTNCTSSTSTAAATRTLGATPPVAPQTDPFQEATTTANASQQPLMSLLAPESHMSDDFQNSIMPFLSPEGTKVDSIASSDALNFGSGSLDFAMSDNGEPSLPALSPSAALLRESVAGLGYAMPITPMTQFPEAIQHALDPHMSPITVSSADHHPGTTSAAGGVVATDESYCSCLEQALGLMKMLFPPPATFCTTAGGRGGGATPPLPPTVSTVVERNRRTVEAVSAMLACHCVHDAHLLAVMAHIVFKVLGWYAVVACRSTTLSPSPSSSNSAKQQGLLRSTPPTTTPYIEQVGWQAECAGRYRLDGDDAGRMAAQLVLGELHRAQSLVRELSAKLKARAAAQNAIAENQANRSASPTIAEQPHMPFSGEILDRLAVDLRVRLKELSADIVRTLRDDLDASGSKADEVSFAQGRRTSR